MQLRDVQLEYEAGHLCEALIEPWQGRGHAKQQNGWIVEFIDQEGRKIMLTRADGAPRVYHDLDSATRRLQDIGFKSVRVEERF